MLLLSLVGDGAMALPRRHLLWHDVATESRWRWHYRGNIGRGVMSLSSLACDGSPKEMLVVV
jgi:hypothetical protein